jgi:hypothetical protein
MTSQFANIVRFLAAGIATVLLVAAFNFAIDPLQLFGHRNFIPHAYTADSRLQNAGLIRSRDFNAVLMGTSLSVHLRPSEINRKFGVQTVKLAMSGSTSVEQRFVLDAALRRRPALVFWEFDDRAFFESPGIDEDEFIQPGLYRLNLKGIANYLFGLDTTRESFFIALGAIRPLKVVAHGLAAAQYLKFYGDEVDEIGTLPVNSDLSAIYNAASIRGAFATAEKYPKEIYVRYDYPTLVRNFERDFVSVISNNPDTRFCVFVPPYSILQFVAIRDVAPKALQTIYDFSAYAFPRLLSLPNVTLFDFRDVQDITHDLDNYMDLLHYRPTVDLRVLSFLASGENRVDRAAPSESIERLARQVAAFDTATMRSQPAGDDADRRQAAAKVAGYESGRTSAPAHAAPRCEDR